MIGVASEEVAPATAGSDLSVQFPAPPCRAFTYRPFAARFGTGRRVATLAISFLPLGL
jgi:hypothetical protein